MSIATLDIKKALAPITDELDKGMEINEPIRACCVIFKKMLPQKNYRVLPVTVP